MREKIHIRLAGFGNHYLIAIQYPLSKLSELGFGFAHVYLHPFSHLTPPLN
ncbi:hypothetical protein PS934_03638 [Pseudomonas fluorescens]|nr:hypothetical protein PS934_03638 [Pseudomonas fluorescens]